MGNIPETPSPTSSPIFFWFPWICPVKSARAIWDIVWSILDSLKYQSHAMSVKRLRITTDKNGMNSMVENYEVTTQNFPTQTSKLF